MKRLAAVSSMLLLALAIVAIPVVGHAQNGVGGVFILPEVQIITGNQVADHIEAFRSFTPVNLSLNYRVYDSNGLTQGTAAFVSPAGVFAGKLVIVLATTALTQLALPPGNYTGALFTIPLTISGMERFVVNGFPNAVSAIHLAPGFLGGGISGYGPAQRIIAIIPKQNPNGTPTNVVTQIVCDILTNNKAADFGTPSPPPGTQHFATVIDANGNAVINNVLHQALTIKEGTALAPGLLNGGTLFLGFNGGGIGKCIQGTQVVNGATVNLQIDTYAAFP